MSMADENYDTYEGPVSEAPIEAPEGAEAEVAAPEADEVREPQAVVVQGDTAAQVAPPRDPDADRVSVHEVSVTLDEVITDPNDPKAVQVPEQDAAAGVLPIHALSNPVPEAVFAEEASEADED